ncbi:hypothetical protein ACNKHL_08945 [Shigella flexneri]
MFILNWNVNWILTVALWCSTGVEQLADRVVLGAGILGFQANRRDIAVVVWQNVPAADILSEM